VLPCLDVRVELLRDLLVDPPFFVARPGSTLLLPQHTTFDVVNVGDGTTRIGRILDDDLPFAL
jgi:hypothetical protein